MAKTTKLQQEEIDALLDIQKKNKIVLEEFGKISILEIDLDNRRERAEKFLTDLRSAEDQLARALEDKYGKGTVNIDKGEFTALGK
jgi:hypothetical protein